jgi:hypothetical protein
MDGFAPGHWDHQKLLHRHLPPPLSGLCIVHRGCCSSWTIPRGSAVREAFKLSIPGGSRISSSCGPHCAREQACRDQWASSGNCPDGLRSITSISFIRRTASRWNSPVSIAWSRTPRPYIKNSPMQESCWTSCVMNFLNTSASADTFCSCSAVVRGLRRINSGLLTSASIRH